MPDDSPFRSGRPVACDDRASLDFLADTLEQPLCALVALQVFESVSLVAEALVQICCPFCDADVARLWVVVDVGCEGESGWIGRRLGD